MRLALIVCFLLSFSISVQGQKIINSFQILDDKRQVLEFASVRLLANDSSLKFLDVTDSNGRVLCKLDSAGVYFMKISAIGFKTMEQNISIKANEAERTIILMPSGNVLNEVVIARAKPLMRQEDDKTIIDPEQLAEASSNGYEVLEKTPGLFIDQDGNIYISSTTPATVYINGRELKMSRSDVASILKIFRPIVLKR